MDEKHKQAIDKVVGFINRFTNLQPVLGALSSGEIVRKVIGRFLQAYAVVLGLLFLISWIRLFGILGHVNFLQGLGLLIWQVTVPYAVFLCLKTVFLRGDEIMRLPDSAFVIAPIVAALILLHGEVALIFLAVMSVPAMLLTWFYSGMAAQFYPIPAEQAFLGGIMVFVLFWVMGFLVYVLARWIQEWTLAIFSIAQNVDLIQKRGDGPCPDSGETAA